MNKLKQTYFIPRYKYKDLITNSYKICETIKNLLNNKAPDADEIPNIVLKNLPKKTIAQNTIFTYKIEKCHEKIPEAQVLPANIGIKQLIEDDRKSTTQTNNVADGENLCIIPESQLGFRSEHSTVHATSQLV